MNPTQQPRSAETPHFQSDSDKKAHSEAAGATISNAPDPQHPPRRKRHGLSMLIVAALLLIGMLFMGIGQAAWPVIDISAVAQLIETVRIAGDSLTEMTTAKEALLGQVANFTGIWSDLTGEAYQLGHNASSLATEFNLTEIEQRVIDQNAAEDTAWPTAADVQNAYAGEDQAVIDRVLDAHQAQTQRRNALRNAWRDSQVVIAEAGNFLATVESTASTQNGEVTQGLGAQLDRQIAVSSSLRDIAAKQLEVALSAEDRADKLRIQRSLVQGQIQQQGLALRTELQDAIADYETDFDAVTFDRNLYTPVLPTN